MKKRKRVVRKLRNVEFALHESESLVVSFTPTLEPGIERVIVENKKGRTRVRAIAVSGSRFEFRDQRKTKEHKNQCDFWVANLEARDFLVDIIRGKFWGQFNWGDLFALDKNRSFKRKIDRVIRKLVDEFMERAATELNKIKKPSLR